MSIVGEMYEEELWEMHKELKKAREYIKDFISILEEEGASTYYSNGRIVSIKELKEFLPK